MYGIDVASKAVTRADVTNMLKALNAGAKMNLNDLRKYVAAVDGSRLRGSIGPDMVSNLLTTTIGAKLVEKFTSYSDNWRGWISVGQSEWLDAQIREVVGQLGEIPATSDTGGRFQEIKPPSIQNVSISIGAYGGFISADLRTRKTDHLDYFSKLGTKLGQAAEARLHKYIYYTLLQADPTLDDGNTLWDETNRDNDLDDSEAGYALTYDHFGEAMEKLAAMTDAASEKYGFGNRVYLVCGSYNREMANQLKNNPNKPGTGNQDYNAWQDTIVAVDIDPKLGYDWYVIDEDGGPELLFFEGKEEPQITMEPTDSTYQFENPGKQRWLVEHYYGGQWPLAGAVRGSSNNEPS